MEIVVNFFRRLENFEFRFLGLLLGIQVPELYRKLREPWSFHVSKDGPKRLAAFRVMTKKLKNRETLIIGGLLTKGMG